MFFFFQQHHRTIPSPQSHEPRFVSGLVSLLLLSPLSVLKIQGPGFLLVSSLRFLLHLLPSNTTFSVAKSWSCQQSPSSLARPTIQMPRLPFSLLASTPFHLKPNHRQQERVLISSCPCLGWGVRPGLPGLDRAIMPNSSGQTPGGNKPTRVGYQIKSPAG